MTMKLIANKIYYEYIHKKKQSIVYNIFTEDEIYSIIIELLVINKPSDYNDFKFLMILTNLILCIQNKELINDIFCNRQYLVFVTKHKHGFIILYKLSDKINIPFKLKIYNTFVKWSSYKTFLFWYNYINYQNTDVSSHFRLIIDTISNTDDRIFKFLLNCYYNNNNNNNNHASSIVEYICITPKPIKIKIIKLKHLSKYINLSDYFEIIINYISDWKSLLLLHNHFHKYHNFTTLNLLTKHVIDYMCAELIQDNIINLHIMHIYKIITDETLQYLMHIVIYIHDKYGVYHHINYNKKKMKLVIENNIISILKVVCYEKLFLLFSNKYFVEIFKLITHDSINAFIINNYEFNIYYTSDLLFKTRFLEVPCNDNWLDTKHIININKMLHLLRIKMKSVYNKKINSHYSYYSKVLHEIKYYEPNHIKVLQKGSLNYQYNRDKFPIIKQHCFTKYEKIVTNTIPQHVYPPSKLLWSTEVYAEYIDKFDIYIVHDIDIQYTTKDERSAIIRNLHVHDDFNVFYYCSKNMPITISLNDNTVITLPSRPLWFYL